PGWRCLLWGWRCSLTAFPSPRRGALLDSSWAPLLVVSRGGGSCSRRLRRRSRKLDEYHGQPSIGHHYKQPSGPSWIHRDWKFRKRKESGTVASRRSFVEDFADKHRDCRGHYLLDGRSYCLHTWHCHHHREFSPKPTIH